MLLVRPYPNDKETIPNYLLRVTAANRYDRPNQILHYNTSPSVKYRSHSKNLFFGDFNIDIVASMLAIEPAQILKLKFERLNNSRTHAFGQSFVTKHLNFSTIRLCPDCIKEKLSIPFHNSLASKTYCVRHNLPLISAHPQTGKLLTWGTPYLWKYAQDWLPVKRPITAAERTINETIENFEQDAISIEGIEMGLADYCDLLEFFAHYHAVAHREQKQTLQKKELGFCLDYYAAAEPYIKSWPHKFYGLLKHYENNPMSKSRQSGIRKCFRDLYDDIYRDVNNDSTAYALLRKEFENYIQYHFLRGMVTPALTKVAPSVLQKSVYLSETQAAKELNCRLSRLRIYIRAELICYGASIANNNLLKRSDVLALKQRLDDCISICDSAKLLGVSVYHVRQLLRAGLLPSLLMPNNNNRDWLIEKGSVYALFNRLKDGAKSDTVNTKSNTKLCNLTRVNLSELVSKMLSNKISYAFDADSSASNSLNQFIPIFDVSDEPMSDYLSPSGAKEELQVNINAIYDFIRLGYLDCIKLPVKRTLRPVKMIPKASLERFKYSYLLSKDLEPELSSEVLLLSGPKIDGCCVKVYSSPHH